MKISLKENTFTITTMIDEWMIEVPKSVDITLRDYSRILMQEMRRVIREEKKYGADPTSGNVGRLERDMSIIKTGNGYMIDVYAPYAAYVDVGASPHTILPVRARRLRWERDGEINYARKVRHPGIVRPMQFRIKAVNRTIDTLRRRMVQDIINRMKVS